MRKMKFQKTSVKVATCFFCVATVELGRKLKKSILSQHKSIMS